MKDVKFCFAHLHIGTLHSKQAITDPAQIKGMKIRPANGTVARCMSLLGGHQRAGVGAGVARRAGKGRGRRDHLPVAFDHHLRHRQGGQVPHRQRLYATTFVWIMNKPLVRQAVAPKQKKVIDDHCNNDVGRQGRRRPGATTRTPAGQDREQAAGPHHRQARRRRSRSTPGRRRSSRSTTSGSTRPARSASDGKAALDDLKRRTGEDRRRVLN